MGLALQTMCSIGRLDSVPPPSCAAEETQEASLPGPAARTSPGPGGLPSPKDSCVACRQLLLGRGFVVLQPRLHQRIGAQRAGTAGVCLRRGLRGAVLQP